MTKNQIIKCFCDHISVNSTCIGTDFLQNKITEEQAVEKLKNVINKVEQAISKIESK